MSDSLEGKLDSLVTRYEELQDLMASQNAMDGQEFVKMSKEYADLATIVEAVNELRAAQSEIGDLASMVADEQDPEVRAMAEEEFHELKTRIPELERNIQLLLLPKDDADEKNVILEVRAGTGGDEAGLFAADLFRMYQRYAEERRWTFEVIDANENGIGGVREATANITGRGAFARLKYESGVHRVQRVPETESQGRIHTSAATVAVLPEAEEVDIEVEAKDLRVDTYRAQGAGGQHVNKTDSAIRITHMPSGIVVTCQDEKSQHKNRAKAMKVLRARLYEKERSEQDAERAANRKSQVGSGDRSERIRTYNYPQGRVTDHRINLTLHKIERVMEGDLDELIDALAAEDQASRLTELQ